MSSLRLLFMKMCGRSELPHWLKPRPNGENQWKQVIHTTMRKSTTFAREYVCRDHETTIDIASMVNIPKFKQNQPPELHMYGHDKELNEQSHQVLKLVHNAIIQRLAAYAVVFGFIASWNFMGILQPPGSQSLGEDGSMEPSPILVGCFVFFSTLSFLFNCIGMFGVWVGSVCLFRPAYFLKFDTTVGSPEPDCTRVETRVRTTVHESSSYYSSNSGSGSKVSSTNNIDSVSVGIDLSNNADSLSVGSTVHVSNNTCSSSVGGKANLTKNSKPGSGQRNQNKPLESGSKKSEPCSPSDLLWNVGKDDEKDDLGRLALLLWDNLERTWRLRIYLIVSLVATVCAFGCGAFATLGGTKVRILLTGAIIVGVVAFLYEIGKTILGIETYHASEWLHMSKWLTSSLRQETNSDHGNSFASPGSNLKDFVKELADKGHSHLAKEHLLSLGQGAERGHSHLAKEQRGHSNLAKEHYSKSDV